MNISSSIQSYLKYLRIYEHRSENTIKTYTTQLKAYEHYLCEQHINDFEKITHQMMVDYLDEVQQSKKVTTLLSAIKGYHRYMNEHYEFHNVSELISVKKTKEHLPIYASESEVEILFNQFNDEPKDIYHHAIIEMLYGLGMRVSEVCLLQVNQVNLEDEIIKVIGKGGHERLIPMPSASAIIFKAYFYQVRALWLSKPNPRFFINHLNKPLNARYVQRLIQTLIQQGQIDKHLTPHKLRHSYATHLLQKKADLRVIQQLLGHKDISTTQIYTQIDASHAVKSYLHHHPMNQLDDTINSLDEQDYDIIKQERGKL